MTWLESLEAAYIRLVRRPGLPPQLRRALLLGAVLVREFERDAVLVRAATLSFWSLVAVVPVLVLTAAVTRPLGLDQVLPIRTIVYRVFLAGPVESVSNTVDELLNAIDFAKLGIAGVIGVLFAGSRIYFSVEEAYNALWSVRTKRPFTTRLMLFYATVTLGPVILTWGFLLTHRVQAAVDVSSLDRVVPIVVSTVAFVLALRSLPDTTVRWGPAIAGGFVTAVLFEGAKVGFGQYTSVLGAADTAAKIYGSLALFPVFLLWLYVLWTIVLLGVELAYVVQRREDLGNAEEKRVAGTPRGMPDAWFALQCLIVVGRRYLAGTGASPEPVVTHALGCEPQVCQECLELLEEAGVVALSEGGYLPAVPLASITGAEVMRRYRARTRPSTGPGAPGTELVEAGIGGIELDRPITELLR